MATWLFKHSVASDYYPTSEVKELSVGYNADTVVFDLSQRMSVRKRGAEWSGEDEKSNYVDKWNASYLTLSFRNGRINIYANGLFRKTGRRRRVKGVRNVTAPILLGTNFSYPLGEIGVSMHRSQGSTTLSSLVTSGFYLGRDNTADLMLDVQAAVYNALRASGNSVVFNNLQRLRNEVFPATWHFPEGMMFTHELSYAYRAKTYQEYVERLAGKRRATKSIVKLVSKDIEQYKDDQRIGALALFPKDVPVDHLRTYLSGMASEYYVPGTNRIKCHADFMRAIYHGDGRRILRLLRRDHSNPYVMQDCISMWVRSGRPALPKLKNLHDYHDELVAFEHQQRYPNKVIDYEKIDPEHELRRLEGQSYGNGAMHIILPRDTNEIAQWGRQQNHCIGTYGYAMEQGQQWLFSVVDGRNGDILYNGRINTRYGTLAEFRGKHNAKPPEAVNDWVRTVVERHIPTKEVEKRYSYDYGINQVLDAPIYDNEAEPIGALPF